MANERVEAESPDSMKAKAVKERPISLLLKPDAPLFSLSRRAVCHPLNRLQPTHTHPRTRAHTMRFCSVFPQNFCQLRLTLSNTGGFQMLAYLQARQECINQRFHQQECVWLKCVWQLMSVSPGLHCNKPFNQNAYGRTGTLRLAVRRP